MNYASLGKVGGIDFGQDTDWDEAARIFPGAEANCIVFPAWVRSRSLPEMQEELSRLMAAGSRFPRFTFSLLELDQELAEGKVFEFHEAFQKAAGLACESPQPRSIAPPGLFVFHRCRDQRS